MTSPAMNPVAAHTTHKSNPKKHHPDQHINPLTQSCYQVWSNLDNEYPLEKFHIVAQKPCIQGDDKCSDPNQDDNQAEITSVSVLQINKKKKTILFFKRKTV